MRAVPCPCKMLYFFIWIPPPPLPSHFKTFVPYHHLSFNNYIISIHTFCTTWWKHLVNINEFRSNIKNIQFVINIKLTHAPYLSLVSVFIKIISFNTGTMVVPFKSTGVGRENNYWTHIAKYILSMHFMIWYVGILPPPPTHTHTHKNFVRPPFLP